MFAHIQVQDSCKISYVLQEFLAQAKFLQEAYHIITNWIPLWLSFDLQTFIFCQMFTKNLADKNIDQSGYIKTYAVEIKFSQPNYYYGWNIKNDSPPRDH